MIATRNKELFGLGVRRNKVNSKIDGVHLVSFIVWDLKAELFFKSHHNFHRV